MNCSNLEINNLPNLAKQIAKNVTKGTPLYNNYLAVIKTPEYQKLLAERGIDIKKEGKKAFEALVEVYNRKTKDLRSIQQGVVKQQNGRFSSKLAKIESLDYIASSIGKLYFIDKFNNNGKFKSLTDIIKFIKIDLFKTLSNEVNSIIANDEELVKEYNEQLANTSNTLALKYIIDKLDRVDLKNKMAAFESLSDKAFIEELKMKKDVAALYGQVDMEYEAVEDENRGSNDEDSSNTNDVDTVDDMSKSWELNIGEKSDFKGHIEEVIKFKLNSIPKLLTANFTVDEKGKINYEFDRSSEVGFVQYMDGQAIASTLFTYTNKSNVDAFIESIAEIARKNANMRGLISLYNDLKRDKNLAYKFMMNFNKPVIPKIATYLDYNGEAQVRISNTNSNPIEITVNSLKYSIKNATPAIVEKFENADINDLSLEEVYDLYKLVFPEIDYKSLEALANDNIKKYQTLVGDITAIKNILKRVTETRDNYIKELNQNKDVKPVTNYFTAGDLKFLYSFAKEIYPYANIKINLNSRNEAGNLSSDVINRSYLTNFPLIFSDESSIETYIRQKFAGNGYNYSNILVEQVLPTGELMPGLFRKQGDKYVLTEYANELVQLSLYNGSVDRRSNISVLYKDMSKGDYLVTGLIDYASKEAKSIDLPDPTQGGMLREYTYATANFFMSIPSDAPKTFVATMPVYSITNLYQFNKEQYERFTIEAERKFDSLNKVDLSDAKYTDWLTNKLNAISNKHILQLINGENVSLPVESGKWYLTNNKPSFAFVDKNGVKYAVKGEVKEINNKLFLTNANLVGIISDGKVTKNQVETSKNAYINNQKYILQQQNIGREFNANHPIVSAFRRIIYQEILDAYISSRRIFKEDANGNLVIGEDGNLVLRDDYNENDLYLNYEKDRNGKVYNIVNGKYVLSGAVFKLSDLNSKFANVSLYHDLMGNDKVIDILYGDREKRVKMINGKIVFDANYQSIVDNAVNNAIKNYLDTYIVNSVNYLRSEFGTFLENYSDETIREYLVNNIINQVNFDHLFNGKSKFYKGNQDVLKRLKEIQAGGSPFGITDFTKTSFDTPVVLQEAIKMPVVNTEGRKVLRPIIDYKTKQPIQLKDKFKAVTVYNTNKPSEPETINRLKKQLDSAGLSKETKDALLEPFEGKTKTNDAQSYITQEEWIRRIVAAGEINKYAGLIEALTNDTPVEDIDWTAFENKVAIQKNFYYDLYYDTKTGLEVPRQIKNAEYVLLPKLIKGTELEKVYNAMREADIDQLNTVETSKAANHNIITLWDNNGNIHLEEFTQEAPNNSEYYSYNYLYRQQEVPEHMTDEENKAGIQILKKMLDNLPDDDYHNNLIKKFFDNYTANIKYRFLELAAELGIQLDKKGNIKLENGSIVGLNRNVFLQLAKENASKNGSDRVLMEFLQYALDGNEQLPLFMNNVSTKLESVTNAIFNSRITRQTIEGWHAAQLSDFGFTVDKDTMRDSEYLKNHEAGHNHKLQYRKQGEINDVPVYYAEIRLRRWSDALYRKVKQEDETIKKIPIDINEVPEELRTMIGYRIPTEGKQSIVVMKVVEFLPDANGSTVVVPDEWVTQTGSDFDVDSVYAMTKHIMQDKNGHIIEPKDTDFTKDEKGYIRYIKSYIDMAARRALGQYNGEIDSTIQFIKDEEKRLRKERDEEFKSEFDDVLNDFYNQKSAIYEAAKETDNQILYNFLSYIPKKEKNEKAIDFVNKLIGKLETAKINNEFEVLNNMIDNMLDTTKDIQQLLDDKIDLEVEEYQGKNERIKKAIEDGRKRMFNQSEKFAIENGLLTYNEWLNLPVENGQNINPEGVSYEVRNNNIVQTFIDILNSPAAFEENMGISQFSDLAEANAKMKKIANISNKHVIDDKSYGNHDAITQLDWKESAGSGIKLKAISVNLDTLASIGNRIKMKLPFYIPVRYSKEIIEQQRDRFVIDGDIIKFDNQGWSKDNKNVAGKLLTPYSSQTTAHILDVMKEGAVHNENVFTFNAFKVMINAGIDYDTAISFMYQPAMDNLVKYWNEGQSFVNSTYINPLRNVLDDAATALGITTDGKSLSDLAGAVYRKYNGKEYITKTYGDVGFPIIDYNLNIKRFSNEMTEEEKKIHDFMVLLQFNKLNQLGNTVNTTLNVLTADKYGAKPSYFSTDKIFRNIDEILNSEHKLYAEVNGKFVSVVEAIFPGIDKGIDNFIKSDISKSAYPSLAAMLKYASATALKTGQQVFETAEPNFVNLVYDIAPFTKSGRVTEKLFNDYQKYLIKRLYVNDNNVAIISPVTIDKDGSVLIASLPTGKLRQTAINQELSRIAGIGVPINAEDTIKIEDINNPTEVELLAFAKLSPAQKVNYIKNNFINTGIFDFITVNKFNEFTINKKGYISMEMKLNQGNYTNDYMYDLFDESYLSTNPLIRLAAIDIVKYVFVVEGNNFKAGNLSRAISTIPLKSDIYGGINIGFNTKSAFNEYRMIEPNSNASKELAIGYIRQNYDTFKTHFVNLESNEAKSQVIASEISYETDGSISIYISNKESNYKLEKLGLIKNDEAYPIIKLRRGNTTKLYYGVNSDDNVIYYPLNKLDEVDSNKTIEDSSIIKNNIYKSLFDVIYEQKSSILAEQYYRLKPAFQDAITINIGTNNELNIATEISNYDFINKKQMVIKNAPFNADYIKIYNEVNGKSYIARRIQESQIDDIRKTDNLSGTIKEYHDYLKKYPKLVPTNDYAIAPVVEYNRLYSSIVERDPVARRIKEAAVEIRKESYKKDKAAENVLRVFNTANINYLDTKAISENKAVAATVQAKYIQAATDRLIHDAYNFSYDEFGNPIAINDERIIKQVLKDDELNHKFASLINTISSFKKRYKFSELNLEGLDEDTKVALQTIKDAINKVNNDTIVLQAKRAYWIHYINERSTNPNIKSGIQDALTFYGDTGFFDLNIQDIAFNHNQLVQAVVSDTEARIKEGELNGKLEAKRFADMLKNLKAEAAKNGKSINWNKIVDENGRLIQPNKKEWDDMYKQLTDKYVEIVDKTKNKNSVEALKAKLDIDIFLNSTTENQFNDYDYTDVTGNTTTINYDKSILRAQYNILYNKGEKAAELYSKYKELMQEQTNILSNIVGNTPTEEQDKLLHDIYIKVRLMTSQFYEDYQLKDIEDADAADALSEFIDISRELKEVFFDREVKDGFEEQLKENLRIISEIEGERDADGKLIVPMNILMKNKDYRKAKSWLRANAMYIPDKEIRDNLNAAYNVLNDPRGRTDSTLNLKIAEANARDEFGIIDGTKFTPEQIQFIKEETVKNYAFSKNSGLPYHGILRSQDEEAIIYNSAFYNNIKSSGIKTQDLIDDIEAINKILNKIWDTNTRTLHTGSDKLTIEDLKLLSQLLDLYNFDKPKNKEAAQFIAEHCTTTYSKLYDIDKNRAKQNGEEWFELWQQVFETTNYEGNIVPNPIFYGIIKPKNIDDWIDKDRTEAIRYINKHTENTKTNYYYDTMRKNKLEMSDEDFKKWYYDNHVYNPYTREWEPLKIWTHTEIIDNGKKAKGDWKPRINQTDLKPKDALVNPNYDKNYKTYKLGSEYKIKGEDGKYTTVNYDNEDYNKLNEYELKLMKELKDLMMKYAFTSSNEYYVKQGYLPSIRKEKEFNYKDIYKEAMAFIGISANIPTDTKWIDLDNIEYNQDYEKDNPMLQMLLDRTSKEYNEIPHFPKPDETEAEFIKRKQEAINANAKIREENLKIHNQLINKDWEEVFKSFIINSSRYNAIHTIKNMLYMADDALNSYEAYKLNYKNELIQNKGLSTDTEIEYKTTANKNTSLQLRNYIRRAVYDMYKNNNNPHILKLASIAQNMAGTKYMMLNITGGIANILTGQANIGMERLAREYFNEKDWLVGQNLYFGGVASYMSNMYSEKSSTLQDGIIKLANVVDYDRIAELTSNDIKGNIKKLRGLLFTPQTAGEHYMQNTVLLTMMKNHRIVKDADGNVHIMSFNMYMREVEKEALMSVINDEERTAYNTFFDEIMNDEARKVDYNLFRRNLITDFIKTHLTKDKMINYIDARKKLISEKKKEFNEAPDLYSQFELVDDMANLKADAEISLRDYAKFVKKVINVNKKIHGVYDKIGAAKIENEWWGGIIMQFHKHLYPGIKKRYRRHAYYDETLETIEKGAYNSLIQFINTPYRETKDKLYSQEITTLQAIQEYMKSAINFIINMKLNYELLSEAEQANIRRNYADVLYVGNAIVGAISLTAIAGGDKDNEESIWYNLLMYHADRLASEAFAFNPIGLASEGEKLWSSPVAIWQSGDDLLKGLAFAAQTLIDNGFDAEYKTGRYAGENKLKVIIGRNIPVYRNIQRIIELPDNNSYYKLGDNALSIIPVKEIGEWIRE